MKKVEVLILLLSFINCHLIAQWQLTNATISIRAVDFVNDSTGLFVHNMIDGSYILKTVDYGVTLDTVANYPPNVYFTDVVFATADVAYACGQYNLFLKSIDGGDTWFDPTEGQDPTFDHLYFANETLGYASGEYSLSKLGVTTDGGLTWTIDDGLGGNDLFFIDDCNVTAVSGTTFKSTIDCDLGWEISAIESINRSWSTLWILNTEEMFIGGQGGFGTFFQFNYGTLGKSIDGGQSFAVLDFPYVNSVNDLFFVGSQIGYAGCSPIDPYPYSILKTIDGGETWGYQEMDINPNLEDYSGMVEIDCPSPGNCYAVGGGVYRTTNGGGEINEAWVEVGVDEYSTEDPSLSVFPNPANDLISISNLPPSNNTAIKITDTAGRLVLTEYNTQQIDVTHLSSGIYFIEVSTEESRAVLRFVKE